MEYALKPFTDPEFTHREGRLPNSPNFQKIAARLNEIFHQGRPIRTASKVCKLRDRKGMISRLPDVHPYWTDRIDSLTQLNEADYLSIIVKIPWFNTPEGLDYSRIAGRLNDVFHEGVEVRNERSVRTKIHRNRQKSN